MNATPAQRKGDDIAGSSCWFVLAAVVISAFGFRLYVNSWHFVMAPDYDGYQYIMIARSMVKGMLSYHAVNWTPLFPAFIAAFSFLPVPQDAIGSFINIVAGSLSTALVFLLVRKLVSARAGLLAAVFYAFNPVISYSDVTVMSETTFFFFCLLTACYAERLSGESAGIPAAVLFGLCGAACYYGRPEGVLLFLSFLSYLLLFSNESSVKARFIFSATACLTFVCAIAPYLLFLKHHTGNFVLSGKSGATVQTLRSALNVSQDAGGVLSIYLHDPLRTLRHFGANIAAYGTILFKFTGHLYLFIAGFLVMIAGRTRENLKTAVLFLCLLAPAVPNLFFLVDIRRSYSFVGAVMIMAGIGLAYFLDCIKIQKRQIGMIMYAVGVILATIVGIVTTTAVLDHPAERQNAERAYVHFVKSGEYLKQYAGAAGAPAELFATAPNYLVAYYAGADYIDISRSLTPEQLFMEMRAKERPFLYVDEILVRKYNQKFSPLLAPESDEYRDSIFPRRLKLIYADYQTMGFIYEYRP